MTREQVIRKLTQYGIKLELRNDYPAPMVEAFGWHMEGRKYGKDKMLEAFHHFKHGWLRAAGRLL